MKPLTPALLLAITAAFPLRGNPVGISITVSDQNYAGSGWYSNREDNETEANPNTINAQVWDLEGMFLNGSQLSLVGGFDFKNGTAHGNKTYRSGDIFIDVTGDAVYGHPANGGSGLGGAVTNSFGYDYVISFDASVSTYSLFSITSSAIVSRGTDVPSSNPWKYVSGGTAVAGYQNIAIGGYGLLSAAEYGSLSTFCSAGPGLLGDALNQPGSNRHYFLTVDVSFLPTDTLTTLHYTIECGNDNLMGQFTTTSVPEGGPTLALLSLSLLGCWLARRRQAAS